MATNQKDVVFSISRLIHAPRQIVWRAWTDPDMLAQWWGPNYFTNPICEIDPRPGGEYRIVMRGPDDVEYPMRGTFQVIEPPERLVMTMDVSEHPDEWHDMINPDRSVANPAGELVCTVHLEDDEDRTQITIHVQFETPQIREAMLKIGMNEGWNQSLDRLAKLVQD